ncbi:MAG: hypothetical protein AAGA73_00950 [Pseudomonadota bacterium]
MSVSKKKSTPLDLRILGDEVKLTRTRPQQLASHSAQRLACLEVIVEEQVLPRLAASYRDDPLNFAISYQKYTPSHHQEISMTIYVTGIDDECAQNIAESFETFLEYLGSKKFYETIWMRGSWLKFCKYYVSRVIARDEIKKRASNVEEVLFGSIKSDLDDRVIDMVCKLMEKFKLSGASTAAVDTGMFLFVLIPDSDGNSSVLAKRLTIWDRSLLNENPSLLKKPLELVEWLEEMKIVDLERWGHRSEFGYWGRPDDRQSTGPYQIA